jgi:hypothetical protein
MIGSPINSFVDFNTPNVDCSGDERDVALPIYDNFGVKFQIKISDELIPADTVLYAAACSEECELIYDPNYEVISTCPRYKFVTNAGVLTDADFPILVGNYAPDPGQPQVPEGSYTQQELLDIIGTTYDTNLPGFDFYSCCEVETITGIVVFLGGAGSAKELRLNVYYGYGYVNFPTTSMNGYVLPNECFRYCILNEGKAVLNCSNLFYRILDPCYTTVFNYYNEENAYDFKYVTYDDSGTDRITENQIRIFVSFQKPEHLIEENVFRRSDKVQQRLSTLIEKEWQGDTGYFSGDQHDKLVAMLKHDYLNVKYDSQNINRRMTQIGAVDKVFPDINNPVTYPAQFKIRDYLYSYTNNNCGFNCGVELVDDCVGGGVTPECPDKWSDEFILVDDQAEIQDDNMIGLPQEGIEVYREGLFQYTSGANFYSLNSATGTVTLTPVGYAGERVAIVEI